MRTTVTLDPDVQALIKTAMRESDVPFKRVVNDALRRGLRPTPPPRSEPFVQAVVDLGEPLIDVSSFNRLADELEDIETLAKMRREALRD
jgi:hypothetical protein